MGEKLRDVNRILRFDWKKKAKETMKTHLLKLMCPLGPARTVIPEVPVEPVALGAGLGLDVESV